MKAFDPIAITKLSEGFGGYAVKTVDYETIGIYNSGANWSVYFPGCERPVNIPASFDHNTVVALLRANGATIEEVGDE